MRKFNLVLFVWLAFVLVANGQFNCKVLVNDLQGQYNGECKKGLAHGEGAAKGVDSYVGKFRKGYPNGFGVYTFANGSAYIGNFKQGKKDGYGLINRVEENGAKQQDYGLWVADSLIVKNDSKALFKVKDRKGIKVIDPKVNRDKAVKNQIWINFQINGVPDKSVVVSKAEITSGKKLNTDKRALGTIVAFDEIEEFPVTFKLEYQIRQTTHFEKTDCMAEVTLFTRGRWEIDINH